MTKTVKRILAVVLLLLVVLLVGCLVFTGNRLADYPEDFKDYKSVVFESEDGTMVAFTENGALYDTEKKHHNYAGVYGLCGRRDYDGEAGYGLHLCGGREGHALR